MTNAVNIAQGGSNNVTMRNRIINGAMVIDQRNAGASVTNSAAAYVYSVDRIKAYGTSGSIFTIQQNAGSVTPPAGFTNYVGVTVIASTSPTGTQQYFMGQTVEGYNVADIGMGTANAKALTVSFWVYSSLTGTFGGALQTGSGSCPFSYTISSANTWTYVTVITNPNTTVTPTSTTTNLGVWVLFDLGSGSSLNGGTSGTWSNNGYNSPTGATKLVSTNGATFYITGVQLEAGTTASPFEYRQYGAELALCQRYCFKMSPTTSYGPYGMGHGTGTTNFRTLIKTAQTMRAQPSLSFSAANTFQWSFGNVLTAISAAEYGVDAFSIGCDTTGVATNNAYLLTSANNTTSSITASAEL